jgi:hypothetical protein
VAATLGDFTSDFDGAFTAAPARTGVITSQLQNASAAFAGQFQSNANRVGSIAATLDNATAVFFGGSPGSQSAPT